MEYFQVRTDPSIQDGWFPGEPMSPDGSIVDARTFTRCQEYHGGPLKLSTARKGQHTRFTLGPFEMPVVDVAVGTKLKRAAPMDLQLIPVEVEGLTAVIVNVLTRADCIGEERTIADKWKDAHGRPDKVGQFRTVVQLFVDPRRTGGAHVLRPEKWTLALIASDHVLASLGSDDLTGIKLVPAT